jgi:hypothetical protein
MDSNVYSAEEGPVAVEPVGLERLEAAIQDLAAHDLDSLPDGVAAARVLALRRMVDRLEGHWLHELAGWMAAVPAAPKMAGWWCAPPAGYAASYG